MNLKYLRKLRPILNKVGKKHGIPVDEGEFILGEFFKSFYKAITDVRIPKVKLPLFGTFQPKVSYIYRSLKASIRFHRLGGTTREYINSRIERIWPVRNRLLRESNNEITWKKWRGEDKLKELEQLELNEKEERVRSKKKVYGSGNNLEESRRILREIQAGLRVESREEGKP